jgi:nitrogen fixation/metabolism regulation signal transduction histidine kinase
VIRTEPVGDEILVVLQRALAEALQPYDSLFGTLLAVGGGGLILALVGAIVVARRMSRPVLALVSAARHVAAGDFGAAVSVRQRDELGTRFKEMPAGLRDRERVRAELERAEGLKARQTFNTSLDYQSMPASNVVGVARPVPDLVIGGQVS